jgi:hypothetical protein
MDGACSTYEGGERCIKSLVKRPEENIPFWGPKQSWEDNIQMGFQEVK